MTANIKITVEINGKQVPLSSISDETLSKIREQELEENAPVFSNTSNRLIVKLTPKVVRTLRRVVGQLNSGTTKENCYMSIEPDGVFGCYDLGTTKESVQKFYSETPQPIFKD